VQKPSILLLSACLALGLSLTNVTGSAAQSISIRLDMGTVTVEVLADGKPVAGATVTTPEGQSFGGPLRTDASGLVMLSLSPGLIDIGVTKIGYEPAITRINVAAGTDRTVRLVLTPAQTRPNQDEIVASTLTGRRMDDQAIPVSVLGRDRIEAGMLMQPGDIARLLNEMPGLRVQTTTPVLGTSIVRMRGLPGRYTRLLSDGMPLFGDRPGGYALLRIPPMDLNRVEVIKGAASAFYGSDALAGAVNLLSRQPGSQPGREFLFSQSAPGATDGVLWLSTPETGATRSWSSTFLTSMHRQEENDVDDDGWSDLPKYARGVVRTRVFWDNRRGRKISGHAGATVETREGGNETIREKLETKTADGGLSGQMILGNGDIVAGSGVLFVQSRTRDFSDARERDRMQTATIELSLRRERTRNTWVAGMGIDWYALRSVDALPTTYVSTRGGLFLHDDFTAAPWLVLSGRVRLDHHNLYSLLFSPSGSVLFRGEKWQARVSASQGYFTPRPLTEEMEAAGLARMTFEEQYEKETARSFSADVMHKTSAGDLTFTVFRTQIDDPALVDRSTYTLRTESDPVVAQGVEISGTARRAAFSLTGNYLFANTRQGGGEALALTPRHSVGLIAAVAGTRGRISVDVSVTGEQRLDANPYRFASEPYTLVGVLGEYRFGRLGLFVTAENLTDVRQTDWDPIVRPLRDVDGRYTVDAWAPLAGRLISGGFRILF
jgi:outer membrane receptor for ferrienterochelin and colicins